MTERSTSRRKFADTPGVTRGILSRLGEDYTLRATEELSAGEPSRDESPANRTDASEQAERVTYTLEAHLEHRRQFPEGNSLQALLTPDEFAKLQAEGLIEPLAVLIARAM